ncbi:interferon-induced very large GTPase 1-like [Anguilla anguilla]|uniref:interferon-induced very large GTPase 1-like n=1 Tax=Anguilla anguilla TaxID=7936 RepID=UPI0015AB714E|nr:interferon-induced very large GTPase 1-like [Anguilla anguilla]
MEETESTEGQAVEEKQLTNLSKVLQKAGLDWRYWTEVFKDKLGVEHSEQLQYLNVSDYDLLNQHVNYGWESRALQKMLGIQEEQLQPEENPASQNEKTQVEHNERQNEKKSLEKQRIKRAKKNLEELKKLHQEGIDQNNAKVKKKLDEIRSALDVPESAWLPSGTPLQDILQPLYQRLCSVEEGFNSPLETISDEEVLRSASGGLALEGMYSSGNLDDLLQKRHQLLEVPESFRLRGPEHKYVYEKKEFNSQESRTKFQKVMERLGVSFSTSLKSTFLGFESEVKNEYEHSEEKSKKSSSEHTYILNTQYNYVPLASCFIEKDKLKLCRSALNELKNIESLLMNVNEKKKPEMLNEVKCFFQTFGSHVNQGPLHFGGIFWWTASAEGFSSSELSEVKSLTSAALNAYVGVGSFLGCSGGMSASLSQSKGSFEGNSSASLLSKVQLSVSKSGGPIETDDHLKWKSGLVTSNKTWHVIDRGDTLVPVWDIILSSHSQDFDNASSLCNFIIEAYTEITKQDTESMWGKNVLSAVTEAQKMIQSVKLWSVSKSQKHLSKLLEIKRKLGEDTKAWVQECLSSRDLQDFLTEITNQNSDTSLRMMMKSVMDQSHDVEDFPNRVKILKWTQHTEEVLPTVTSASEFSDLERILNDVKENFCNLNSDSDMSAEEKATCTITSAINSLCQRLRANSETDVELLILSIVNVLGYRRDTFCPLLGVEEIAFLQSSLHTCYENYLSFKERSEDKAQAYLLLTALTVSTGKQRISPEDKKGRLKFFISKAGNISIISDLIDSTHKQKDWKKLEQELNRIINETSQSKEQVLLLKIQTLGSFMKPLERKDRPTQQNASGKTGTEEHPPVNDWKVDKLRGLLQRLGLWESYPRKIKMEDVLLVSNISSTDLNTMEKGLYQQYIYKLMMLDCSARYLCLKATKSSKPQPTTAEDADSSDEEDYIVTEDTLCAEDVCDMDSSVHPMDIHMAVFHCSDDFVRQYIFSKLSTCQFALPLLVPNPFSGEIEFPVWALRQIKKTWQNTQQPIFSAQVPIVSFVRLGKSSNSKSHILSNIINQRKHPVFFNRHCAGSMRHCLLMDGVVEITWYCAGSSERDIFDNCVAFVNLHGDASHHPRQLQFLQEVSAVTVLLLSESPLEEKASKTFKELRKSPTPLITLISHAEKVQGKSQTNIKIAAKNRNEAELTGEIISSIKQCLPTKSERHSLADCLRIARQKQFSIDEDNEKCKKGKEQAEHMVSLLKGENRKDRQEEEELMNLKGRHLPLQGELWENWCRKDKEQHRLHSTGERSNEMVLSDIKSEKQDIRLQQLNKAFHLSDFMKSFLQCLHQTEENNTLYMLQWLQIFLEEYTTGSYANLQEKDQEPKGEDMEPEKVSFGLQHLMREVSQLYEAVNSVTKSEGFTDIQCVDILPRIGAQMLIAGYPLELMDGDVAHVPLDWIKAVFDKLIKKLGDKKVFVLSVLGLQSSGKSTLLNTMFGLQLPVSAGRCTKGAFMQLLTVDEAMKEQLQFDFVLVVDTEGLRSLELSSEATLAHDNELATFIIGVGNMTLINIMGENPSEMQDILQICVQAFMRMTSVKIKTSCIFVHQNVAETTANDKNKEGRRRLKKRLDDMACIAAKEENLDIKCFSDIIHFDVDSQVFYFKNLLVGDPPMAPPNPSYTQNVQKLKDKLLSITKWKPDCRLPSLPEVKERIQNLWDALLKENFVFSFRNTLEISTYSKLEKSYGQWAWSIRKHALEIQQTWHNKINSNLVDEVYMSDLIKEFDKIYAQLTDEIETYFTREEHPEILVNWRCNVDTRFQTLKDKLIEDTQRKCRDLLNIRKCRSELDGKRSGYEAELLRMSRSLASILQDQKLTSDQMRPHFDELWTKWLTKISSEKRPEKQVDIQAVVEGILYNKFKKEKDISQKIKKHKEMISFQFQVDKHVSRHWIKRFFSVFQSSETANIKKEGQRITEQIAADVQKYIKRKSRENVDFNEIFIHEILESISQTLETYEKREKLIELVKEYEVDISIYSCTKAVERFTKMHADFKRKNDLLTCLSEKKEEYFQYFKDSCDGATAVTIFANFLCNYLKSAIKQQMYHKVSLQIVDQMKHNYPAFNGNRANLEDHILKELAEKEKFDLYVEYLERPKEHFEKFIRGRVKECCRDQSLTSDLLNRNLKRLVEKTLTESSIVTSELKEKEGTIAMWLEKFCSKLGSFISISRANFKNIECEGTGNLSFLQDMMAKSLSDMQEQTEQEIKASSLDFEMFQNRPDDILIDQLSGCWEQCPFCTAICTNTMTGHDTDHSVRFHRPETLGGWRYRGTQEFSVDFCTTSVSGNSHFYNREGIKTPFKEYRKAGPPFDKWSIKPDCSEKLYWKWFVCVFRNKLQEKFGCKFEGKGEIPGDWENITKTAVLKELEV